MSPSSNLDGLLWLHSNARRLLLLVLVTLINAASTTTMVALPKRLVVAIDGVSYRDMKALQEGVTYVDSHGKQLHRQAFNDGYFPVSRNVSTFPSTSDVAWTDILGDRPLPGYQRTYFSSSVNSLLAVNSITSSMEYESQMDCEVESGFLRALGYVAPLHMFRYELHELVHHFLQCTNKTDTYYAYLRSTDDAQHLSGDILAMLCVLDEQLKQVRAVYRKREGRELEVLILSDHANNHAGAGRRVEVRAFLKKAGYRFTDSIRSRKDIVLPTAGIESWVEIHNAPAETERLTELLSHLKGVDVLTARNPQQTNRFIVLNSKGERAAIDWNLVQNSFRYTAETGDPIDYLAVVEALRKKNQMTPDGFAPSDAWMSETLTHRYPLALERIARGHTRITQNPATILISLSNDFVHCDWIIKKGSELVKSGGTHGGLDDLNSVGVLLSSFAPTRDTSTSRVAAQFDGFPGLRDFRAQGTGADWICEKNEALVRTARGSLDCDCDEAGVDQVFLRVWTPGFSRLHDARIDVTVRQVQRFAPVRIRRSDPVPVNASEQRLTLKAALSSPDQCSYERFYAFPVDLKLERQKSYQMIGRINAGENYTGSFRLPFHTNDRGLPEAY